MRFSNRILIFFLGFFIVTMTISGVIIIEKVHADMIDNDINEMINYEYSIIYIINNFLIGSNILNEQDRMNLIADYLISANREKNFFELHSNYELIVKTHNNDWNIKRDDIQYAMDNGKNYLLKKINSKYYIFVSHAVVIDENTYVLSLIKDIDYIMISRKAQYQFFIFLTLIILALTIVVSYFITRFITKDITILNKVTTEIRDGHYSARTHLKKKDEIGLIGQHIDEMASEIENNIMRLQHETESKQKFIDNFTHELKTPLTSIIGYADILRKSKYDKEIFDKGLYHIYEEGLRLSQLSKQLNEIIILKNMTLEKRKFNLQTIFYEVIEVNKMRQYNKFVNLVVKCPELIIEVDKNLMKSVLINIIDNAIKASENNQTVVIGATSNEKGIYIFIEDHGIGISQADLSHIVEPFYIVDQSRSRKEESFGLGLSITSEMVSLLGANMIFKSEINQGTRVEIIFEFTTS